jgi:hypothetical protein
VTSSPSVRRLQKFCAASVSSSASRLYGSSLDVNWVLVTRNQKLYSQILFFRTAVFNCTTPFSTASISFNNNLTMAVRFQVLFLVVVLLFREDVNGLSTNRGPTFSISEQALFGGYSNGEASLFGPRSIMSGGQPLWKGKKMSVGMDTPSHKKAPFSGDRVESMTFVVSKNLINDNNNIDDNNESSESS